MPGPLDCPAEGAARYECTPLGVLLSRTPPWHHSAAQQNAASSNEVGMPRRRAVRPSYVAICRVVAIAAFAQGVERAVMFPRRRGARL